MKPPIPSFWKFTCSLLDCLFLLLWLTQFSWHPSPSLVRTAFFLILVKLYKRLVSSPTLDNIRFKDSNQFVISWKTLPIYLFIYLLISFVCLFVYKCINLFVLNGPWACTLSNFTSYYTILVCLLLPSKQARECTSREGFIPRAENRNAILPFNSRCPLVTGSYETCCKCYYYDYHLSEARKEFGDEVLTSKRQFCQGQLAVFPVVTNHHVTSLAMKARQIEIASDLLSCSRKSEIHLVSIWLNTPYCMV